MLKDAVLLAVADDLVEFEWKNHRYRATSSSLVRLLDDGGEQELPGAGDVEASLHWLKYRRLPKRCTQPPQDEDQDPDDDLEP